MRCAQCRECLSARLDGEPAPESPESVDGHVASCAACGAWWARAQLLQPKLRVRLADRVPDLSAEIVSRAPTPSRVRLTRVVLALVALAQCVLSGAQLLGLADGMHGHHDHSGFMMGHLTNESTAWNLAIGIGLLWAAARPQAASGQLPVITGFVLVLGAASVNDLLNERVTVERLLSHGFIVVGLVLLYLVRYQHRRDEHPTPVGGPAVASGGSFDHAAETGHDEVSVSRSGVDGPHRPASEHRAA